MSGSPPVIYTKLRSERECLANLVDYIQQLLGYLGEPTYAPRIAPAAHGPPRWEEDFDPREGTEGTDLSQPLLEFEFDQRVSW